MFKLLFTANDDDSREALRLLLSDCTHRPVRNVQVQNNEILPEYLTGKTVRLDIHVTFNDGEQADLEIIIYEMPKLKQVVTAYFEGRVELKNLSPEQKWCIYFRYKGNEKMESLIQELCKQEEGIMRADRGSWLYAAGKAGEERGHLQAKEETARKMKADGLSTDKITTYTCLSLTDEAVPKSGGPKGP
ncbi:hypothetical protein AGMMS50268_05350 [Spirochaetia bacterium]|nr:hypothetical protein AGMMS50268_05350 [Spirochaetia bacterium]